MKYIYSYSNKYIPVLRKVLLVMLTFQILATSANADSPVICWTNGHCYQTIDGSFTWDAAKSDAESRTYNGMPGHLATITSQLENKFIVDSFITDFRWLGGYQLGLSPEPDGGWQWVTGETWSYTNWNLLYLNNYGMVEESLAFTAESDGPANWNDEMGNYPKPDGYVIEFEGPASIPIPEFPTVTLPIISIITLMLLVMRRKQ